MKFLTLHCFRGIACICVMLYHSNFVSGIEVNPLVANSVFFVDFFFILSGFVIAFSYEKKIQEGAINFKQFILLRLAGRLYPMHIFTLILFLPYILLKFWIYSRYGIGSDPINLHTYTSFFSNVFMIHGIIENVPSCGWNGPSWTMSVELFLYIIFYFLMSNFKHLLSFKKSIIFSIISISAYTLCSNGYSTNYLLTYVMLRGIGGFCAGVTIFKIYENPKNRLTFLPPFMFDIIECVVLITSAYLIAYGTTMMAIISLMVVVYSFAIQEGGIISKIIKNRFLSKISDWSASIYMNHFLILALFHNFFMYILKFPVIIQNDRKLIITDWAILINLFLVLLVLLLSYLTYSYIEMPCRSFIRKKIYSKNEN